MPAQLDRIWKCNIINEAESLESALSVCSLSVVSYTVIHFNGLHAWKCKTSRNEESAGLSEDRALRLAYFSSPLSSPRSFPFQCFSDSLSALFPPISLPLCVVNNFPLSPKHCPSAIKPHGIRCSKYHNSQLLVIDLCSITVSFCLFSLSFPAFHLHLLVFHHSSAVSTNILPRFH